PALGGGAGAAAPHRRQLRHRSALKIITCRGIASARHVVQAIKGVDMRRIAIVMILGSLWTPAVSARAAAQADPSNVRVTIDYRAAPAADVLAALAAAAGVPLELGAGAMRPVTITLTNVRLRTAIDAVCDNALCSWSLMVMGALRVTPLPSEKSAGLPQRVSFTLHDT